MSYRVKSVALLVSVEHEDGLTVDYTLALDPECVSHFLGSGWFDMQHRDGCSCTPLEVKG